MLLKKYTIIGIISLAMVVLTACGGPSEEKIEEAKASYYELVEVHNLTVQAHEGVEEYVGEGELVTLSEAVRQFLDLNLLEMKEDEIDGMILDMDRISQEYERHIKALEEQKVREEAAVIVEVPVSIRNQTGKEISELYLIRKDDSGEELSAEGNILPDGGVLGTGEVLTGLVIRKDVAATPWELLISGDEVSEIEIPVDALDESGVELELHFDEETNGIIVRT